MKRILLIAALCAACSQPNDTKPVDDASGDGTTDMASDLGAVDDGGGSDDASMSDANTADLSLDVAADVGAADVSADASADQGGADASTDLGVDAGVVCQSNGFSGGGGQCTSRYTCDGVAYVVTCDTTTMAADNCTCEVDGVVVSQLTGTFCDNRVLRACGAQVPPVNPICYEEDIGDFVGSDSCGAHITCNDVRYRFTCERPNGACSCTIDEQPGPTSTAVDCVFADRMDSLIECGAPIQMAP